MKKLYIAILKLLSSKMISCEKAAYLISKAEDSKLSIMDKINLKYHNFICVQCQYYEDEIKFISHQVKHYNGMLHQDKIQHTLSNNTRQKWEKLIDKELEEKE